jgi:hypothetical protein
MVKLRTFFLVYTTIFFGCALSVHAQEVSNVQVGYVPEIKRFEVYFDLDSKLKQGVDLKVYVQEYPNGTRKQVETSSIHGLSLKGIMPGFNYYFQIDTKGLNLPPSEYVFEITPTTLQAKGEFKQVEVLKKEVVDSAPRKTIQIIQPFEQAFKFASIGISPITLGGEQSNLTIASNFGVINGGYGYSLSVLYGLSGSPSTTYVASNTQITNYSRANSIYKFTNEVKTSRLSIVPSFLLGIKEFLYVRAGLGYGSRALYWAADEFSFTGTKTGEIWAKNSFASQSGLELEGGFNLMFKKMHIATGINYLGLFKTADTKAFSDVWIGFGLNF